jgi:hypothetical protein
VFQIQTLRVPGWELLRDAMLEAKTYRQYAEDCRRIAQTMNAKDKAVMIEMAKLWDERADEAERLAKDKTDRF